MVNFTTKTKVVTRIKKGRGQNKGGSHGSSNEFDHYRSNRYFFVPHGMSLPKRHKAKVDNSI
jgi:hypothetical protein